MKEKIILGTVQLGIPYGINNTTGKPPEQIAFQILDLAFENNIRVLDSADGYGEALKVIGRHKAATGKSFHVINKFKKDEEPLRSKVEACLQLLKAPRLSCYMYHQFSDYESNAARSELMELKDLGLIEKTGVSLYDTHQLAKVVDDRYVDVIQLPVNILDLTAEKQALLRRAKANGKEIHARSVYLQGLLLKDTNSLTGNLKPLKSYVDNIAAISRSHQTDLKAAALNYVLHQDYIDNVVIGIEKPDQLVDNLSLIKDSFDLSMFKNVVVHENDAHLLNPVNWRP